MDLEEAEAIVNELERACIEAVVREGYSGRGMGDRTCIGIVVEADYVDAVHWAAGKIGMDYYDVPERTDQMGKSDMIVY